MSSKLVVRFEEVIGGGGGGGSDGGTSQGDVHDDTALDIPFCDMQTLMQQNAILQDALAAMRNAPKGTAINDSTIQQLIVSAQVAADNIKPHLETLWAQIPAQQKPSLNTNSKAQEVFHLPELLEHILLQLPPFDILTAQGVAKVWQSGIKTSVNIKRALGLAPDNEGNYQTIFDHISLPSITYDTPRVHDGSLSVFQADNKLKIAIAISMTEKMVVGKTCLSMLLCQPPIKTAELKLIALRNEPRNPFTRDRSFTCQMRSKTGITIGQLRRACDMVKSRAEEILKEEEVSGGSGKCDRRTLNMSATVNLNANDPRMKAREAYVEKKVNRLNKKLHRGQKILAATQGEYVYDFDSDDSGSDDSDNEWKDTDDQLW